MGKHTKIKLGENEAALVFKQDGSVNVYLPDQPEGEDANIASVNAMRCAVMLDYKELVERVDELVDELVENAKG